MVRRRFLRHEWRFGHGKRDAAIIPLFVGAVYGVFSLLLRWGDLTPRSPGVDVSDKPIVSLLVSLVNLLSDILGVTVFDVNTVAQ